MTTETGYVFELDTKAVSDEGEFTGYAAIFNVADLGRDIIVPNAFTKSLQQRPAGKVRMLFQHDPSEPIGIWLDLSEDQKGLRAKGKLILETTKGRETHALMRAGALDGLSIGFRTLKDRYDRAKGVRYLEQLDVPEISVVTLMRASASRPALLSSKNRAASVLAPEKAPLILSAISFCALR
jgi:HK97 family phage prohead protease